MAGYSSGSSTGEVYHVEIKNGICPEPQCVISQEDEGLIVWEGHTDPISRLLRGFGVGLGSVLHNNLSVPLEKVEPALAVIERELTTPLIQPAMPIQDAIDLTEFLINVTIGYSRFSPGAPTAGGPVEIAVITKHEHFKWVRRKYYYPRELNPES